MQRRNVDGRNDHVVRRLVEIASTPASGLKELRERNRLRVIQALKNHSPLSSAALSRATGLSRTTLWAVVRALAQDGLILRSGLIRPGQRAGRPGVGLIARPGANRESHETISELRKSIRGVACK